MEIETLVQRAIAVKEVLVKDALTETFSADADEATIQRINAAFDKASKGLRSHLIAIFGKDEAERVLPFVGD